MTCSTPIPKIIKMGSPVGGLALGLQPMKAVSPQGTDNVVYRLGVCARGELGPVVVRIFGYGGVICGHAMLRLM
jgi:hypothetical protein